LIRKSHFHGNTFNGLHISKSGFDHNISSDLEMRIADPIYQGCSNNTARINNPFITPLNFKGCTWNGTEGFDGGALYYYKHDGATLIVRECSFVNTTANFGGGIAVSEIGTAHLISSLFENTSAGFSGAYHLKLISHSTLVHNCSFDNCTADLDTGGLRLQMFNITSTDSDHLKYSTVFGCRFYNCSSTNDYCGGLLIYQQQ
jgi:hypothetical protein